MEGAAMPPLEMLMKGLTLELDHLTAYPTPEQNANYYLTKSVFLTMLDNEKSVF